MGPGLEVWLVMLSMDTPRENEVISAHTTIEEAQLEASTLQDHHLGPWTYYASGPWPLEHTTKRGS